MNARHEFERDTPEHIYHACTRKKPFDDEHIARLQAKRLRKRTGIAYGVYECRYCHNWHVGRHRKPSSMKRFIEQIKSEPGGDAQSIFQAHMERSITE